MSIRKIKRNISEAATGHRCNRYGGEGRKSGNRRRPSFNSRRAVIASYVVGLFRLDEYLKHKPHQKALVRMINQERNDREDAALRERQELSGQRRSN